METRKHEQDHLKEDNEANKRIRNESTESKVSSMKTSTTSTTLLVPRVVTGLVPRRAVVGRLTTVSGRPRINRKAPAAFPVLASTKLAAVQTSNDSTSDVKQDVASDLSTDNVSKSIIHDPQTRSAHHSRNQQWEGSDSSGRENKPYDASAHKNLGEDQTPAPSEISVDKARRLKNIIPRPLNHTITRIKKNNRQEVAFPYGNYPRYYEGRVRAVIGAASQGKQQVKVRCPTDLLLFRKGTHDAPEPTCASSTSTTVPSLPSPVPTLSALSTRERYREHAKMVDGRLEFLEPEWFRFKRVLDIGCNSGLLTIFIGLHYQPIRIQGVDIDSALIQQATNFVLRTYSKLAPDAYPCPKTRSGERALSFTEYIKKRFVPTSATISTAEVESSTQTSHQDEKGLLSNLDTLPYYEDYFPRSMSVIHGYMPIPKKTEESQYVFPHNMEFRVTDWVTEGENENNISKSGNENDKGQEALWDVILGFSLTKWIHLHHGDDGIKRFFHKVYRSLAPGGIFLLEPQKFATYTKRAKLMPEMHKTYLNIQFKPEQFEQYLLEEVGFQRVVHLGSVDTKSKNFNRPIVMYCK